MKQGSYHAHAPCFALARYGTTGVCRLPRGSFQRMRVLSGDVEPSSVGVLRSACFCDGAGTKYPGGGNSGLSGETPHGELLYGL